MKYFSCLILGSSYLNNDFFINTNSSSFTSQFFPGKNKWIDSKINDNITPDSGIDDLTPGSIGDNFSYQRELSPKSIPTLKTLAIIATNKINAKTKTKEIIGGLNYSRSSLKLDLSSPTIFNGNRTFLFEKQTDAFHAHDKPTFTTFGKSRFSVQQVNTPDDSQENSINVSFEAIPHKPLHKIITDKILSEKKSKIEIVRGEASLLDSADEDSGIESCMLK